MIRPILLCAATLLLGQTTDTGDQRKRPAASMPDSRPLELGVVQRFNRSFAPGAHVDERHLSAYGDDGAKDGLTVGQARRTLPSRRKASEARSLPLARLVDCGDRRLYIRNIP